MATASKGLRRIVVDGVSYAWRIRRKATYCQADYGTGKLHVAVQLESSPGSVLVIFTDRPHPADWSTKVVVPITPADVADWVRQALRLGWQPVVSGPQFWVDVADGRLVIQSREVVPFSVAAGR